MCRRPVCQTLSKVFDMSSAAAKVAAQILKVLIIIIFSVSEIYIFMQHTTVEKQKIHSTIAENIF